MDAGSGIFQFDKDTYVYGIWFQPGEGRDLMAVMTKEDGENWVLKWRFRHYRDSDAFESNDEKSVYVMTSTDDSEEARDKIINGWKQVCSKLVNETDWGKYDLDEVILDCRGDDSKIFFELGSRPWAHMKQLTEEEAREAGLID